MCTKLVLQFFFKLPFLLHVFTSNAQSVMSFNNATLLKYLKVKSPTVSVSRPVSFFLVFKRNG